MEATGTSTLGGTTATGYASSWPTPAAPCPSCGHCPTCGRGHSAPAYPSWPDYPYWTYQNAVNCSTSAHQG